MAFVQVQGFESVAQPADFTTQGFVNTFGWPTYSKPSSRFSVTRSMQFEDSLQGNTDVSPNFAGTTTFQNNTGRTINALWQTGGFVFGAAAKHRDVNQQYALGDFNGYNLTIVGTANDVSSAEKMCFDGTRYWALASQISTASTSTSATELRYSTDLHTWQSPATQPACTSVTGYLNHISYVNGILVATAQAGSGLGTAGSYYWYSSDAGATWTQARVSTAASAGGCSNVVYVASTGTYYIGIANNGGSLYTTLKASNIAGPWTVIDTYVNNTGNTGGYSIVAHLLLDTYRNVVWICAHNSQTATSQTAKIRYFSTATEVFTNAWITNSPGNNANANQRCIAASSTVVLSPSLDGTLMRSTSADLTTWTRVSPTHGALGVVYNAASDQFILFSSDGYVGYSAGNDGINWTYMLPFGFTSSTVAARLYWSCGLVANGLVIGYGRQGVMYTDGTTNTTGWAISYRPELWRSNNATATNARASRLGVAAINSSGRQGYVGLGYLGDLTSATGGTCSLISVNTVSDTTANPSQLIPYLSSSGTPWHFFELVFTATATTNQFNVQVVVDGTVSPTMTASAVQLAPTTDTTSTLYWTVPVRDSSASSVQPSLVEFDDVYILDYSGTTNNTVLFDCHIVPYRPSGDVQAQWTKTPSTAATNAAAARALAGSTAAGNVSALNNAATDIYNADNSQDISAYSVRAVTVEANMSNTSLTNSTSKVGLQSGSSNVDSGNLTIALGTTTFAQKIQETDPATSNAWTKAAAKAAQITLTKVS